MMKPIYVWHVKSAIRSLLKPPVVVVVACLLYLPLAIARMIKAGPE